MPTKWISGFLEEDLLKENKIIEWFAIRTEINALKGSGRTPTIARKGARSSSPTDIPSGPTPGLQPQSLSTNPLGSLGSSHAMFNFKKELPVLLKFWHHDFRPAAELTLYPRSDSRLRLSDFKVELGAREIEQVASLEVFHFRDNTWASARWDTPHLIEYAGQILCARYFGVDNVDGFDEIRCWAFPNAPVNH
ncbi:hypothetical protein CVT26_007833 [Gymnopilus dilepis]|uniref:Uncharacterized protein n=1 Tax=Gymnopilus dilepis TaxID=231916 RepID=A0A409WTC4_9AGAR|nr:hypothetical protein CVT26_007833 [Gymnopilus dilepis]